MIGMTNDMKPTFSRQRIVSPAPVKLNGLLNDKPVFEQLCDAIL